MSASRSVDGSSFWSCPHGLHRPEWLRCVGAFVCASCGEPLCAERRWRWSLGGDIHLPEPYAVGAAAVYDSSRRASVAPSGRG